MKVFYWIVLFLCYIIVEAGEYETLMKSQNQIYADHPHLACTVCRAVGKGNCHNCPFLEDIPICKLIGEYESFTNMKADIHKDMALMTPFKGNCSSDYGDNLKLGHLMNALEMKDGPPDIIMCVTCNMVIGLIQFIVEQFVMNPQIDGILSVLCLEITGCTPDLLNAVLVGLAQALQNFYIIIGVDILNCPNFQDFVNQCYGGQ